MDQGDEISLFCGCRGPCARLIREEKHPEQLAVKKKLRDFEELERKAAEEIRRIHEEHEKRRKSLGMVPGLSR